MAKTFALFLLLASSGLFSDAYGMSLKGIPNDYSLTKTIKIDSENYEFTETLEVKGCDSVGDWKRALLETASDGRATLMLIPPGDDVTQPRLLFGIRFFSHEWLDNNGVECDKPGDFVSWVNDFSIREDPSSKISIIEEGECDVMYEQTCKNPKSITLSRVIRTDNGIHLVTYVSMSPISPAERQKWLQTFKRAEIVAVER